MLAGMCFGEGALSLPSGGHDSCVHARAWYSMQRALRGSQVRQASLVSCCLDGKVVGSDDTSVLTSSGSVLRNYRVSTFTGSHDKLIRSTAACNLD